MPVKPELRSIDNLVKRINRRITEVAATFGTQSPQMQHIETLIYNVYNMPEQTRTNRQGIIQISRSTKNLRFSETELATKVLEKLYKATSVSEFKRNILQSYLNRMNPDMQEPQMQELLDSITKREQADIIAREIRYYTALQNAIAVALDVIYKHSRKTRSEIQALDRVSQLSKGKWTTRENLTEMLETLTKTLDTEGERIKRDFYTQIGMV